MHADKDMSVSIAKMNQIIGKVYRILKIDKCPNKAKRLTHMPILRRIRLYGNVSWFLTKKPYSKIAAADTNF